MKLRRRSRAEDDGAPPADPSDVDDPVADAPADQVDDVEAEVAEGGAVEVIVETEVAEVAVEEDAAWASVVDEDRAEEIDDVATGGPADPAVRTSRAGRNVPIAIGVGLALGALILATLFIYKISFGYLVGITVLYGCWEMGRAVGAAGARVSMTPVLVGAAAIIAAAWARGGSGLVVAVLLTVCGVAIWRIADGAEHFARDLAASVLIVLYLPTLAAFAVLLVRPDDGPARVVAFVATVVCSDTGGFATGVLFGRHPLAPVVSKAKTWEGMAGSVAFCVTLGVLLFTLTFHQPWWEGALFGLALTVTATVGDLGESMIKRDLKIKDMGTLLPGHGGIMDRMDSLLPCAAVAYLLLSVFVPR